MLKDKPTFRVGTINDSYYSIKSNIDMLEDEGKITVKNLGPSPDGKVTNEFVIYPNDGGERFTIYDYKFGFDPSDEDHYDEEYNFSIGGSNPESVESARQLGFNVENYLQEIKQMPNDDLDEYFINKMKYRAGIIK